MKKAYLYALFFLVMLTAAAPYSLKQQMLADLFFLKNLCVVKYAPLEWKKSYSGYDLDLAYQVAKNKILKLSNPTVKEYQVILKNFALSFRDYHVGVHFLSMEEACLPITVRGANNRYFIVHVDHKKIPFEKCSVGDEILEMDGRPFASVIEELRREIGENGSKTERACAELTFSCRRAEVGDKIPREKKATFLIRRNASLQLETLETEWTYTKEKIQEVGLPPLTAAPTFVPTRADMGQFFEKNFCHPAYKNSDCSEKNNPHGMGNKKSFLPALGKKVWVEEPDRLFHSYIFELPTEKKVAHIGYLRIPHYYAKGRDALSQLAQLRELIKTMEDKTDALIIDQMNNPGGSLFYLYAIASLFTDKPLQLPKHQIALTQEEIYGAAHILDVLEEVKDNASAKEVLGASVDGYPVDYPFVKNVRQFCNHLMQQWNEGKHFSTPTYLWGVEEIKPCALINYTKPVLMLINCLDFSGGDFFPVILRDNGCVTLMGETTAGAGGYVSAVEYPNILGIGSFYFTGSFALRSNNLPIENLGIEPDIPYSLTEEDFTQNYQPYCKKILESIYLLLKVL